MKGKSEMLIELEEDLIRNVSRLEGTPMPLFVARIRIDYLRNLSDEELFSKGKFSFRVLMLIKDTVSCLEIDPSLKRHLTELTREVLRIAGYDSHIYK